MNDEAMKNMKDNKRRDAHPYYIWESIMGTPEILAQCLEKDVQQSINTIADKIIEKKINKIFLIGTGSSYFATYAEKYVFTALTGIPTFNNITTEFYNYPPITLDDHSAVFFHSHSGGTQGDPETVAMAKEKGAYTVGVTDIPTSQLAQCVDEPLIGPGGGKVELPATRTYSAAIFRMMLLAVAIAKRTKVSDAVTAFEKELSRVPALLRETADTYAEAVKPIVENVKDCGNFFVIGSGPNYATADEGALGMSQSAGVPAQAFAVENFLHGPIQTLRKGMGVIAIAPRGKSEQRIIQTAKGCKIIGAKVVLVTSRDKSEFKDFDGVIQIPDEVDEMVSPLYCMTPLWQLAYHFSLLGRGSHTDRLAMDLPEFKEAFAVIMADDKKFAL